MAKQSISITGSTDRFYCGKYKLIQNNVQNCCKTFEAIDKGGKGCLASMIQNIPPHLPHSLQR